MPLSLIPAPAAHVRMGAGPLSPAGKTTWPDPSSPQPPEAHVKHLLKPDAYMSPQCTPEPDSTATARRSSPLQVLTATAKDTTTRPGSWGRSVAQLPAVDASLAADSMLVYPDGALGAFAGAAFSPGLTQQPPTLGAGLHNAFDGTGSPQHHQLRQSTAVAPGAAGFGGRDSTGQPSPGSSSSPTQRQGTGAAAGYEEGAHHEIALTLPAEVTSRPADVPDGSLRLPPSPLGGRLFFYTAPETRSAQDAVSSTSPERRGLEATAAGSLPMLGRCALLLTSAGHLAFGGTCSSNPAPCSAACQISTVPFP